MTTKSGFLSLLLVSLTVILASCGPIYENRFRLVPPGDLRGRECTRQCQSTRDQCEDMIRLEQQNCELRENVEQMKCEQEYRRRGDEKHLYYCSPSSCDIDNSRCETRFHECFQFCGGEVIPERVCVMNCAQAPY